MYTLKTKGLTETVTLKNLPSLRIAFVVASLLIVVSYLFEGKYPVLHWLPLLPAFGLMLAGLSGFCPMVYFVQKLMK
ncbi:hypothetical protein KC902_00675 [Candidatus Kaiserbacteria bacterium]|nr:hypothetical protein [Candidatus Kaiserbacteria bacterium]USN89110.1 MAG: hypothetical protein H6780_01685 [Candidatus Nomurabacteria bacterium]